MSVKSPTAQGSKKILAKKQNNPGTFKVENPKKMKKVSKHSNSEDKTIKKKKNKESKQILLSETSDSVSKGSEKASNKKRAFQEASNEEVPTSKRAKLQPKLKKQQFMNDHKEDVSSSIGKKQSTKKRILDKGTNDNDSSPKKVKFSSNKFPLKAKKGFPSDSKNLKKNGTETSEKPDWNKLKEEKKALREKRRAAQKNADSYEVSVEAKKILESIRSRKCPAAEQIKQLETLYSLLKGKLLSVVYAHDMSRVVETMLKFAHTHKQADMLDKMFKELVPEVLEMSKRKYATHVARAMVAHSLPNQRASIVKAFHGHILKLLSHKIGSVVLEHLYVKCKPEEQCGLQKELYGGSHKLISSKPVTGLSVIFEELPNMKESTLTNTKEILLGLFEKNVVGSHIVHSVLLDYLGFASPTDSAEILDQARNHIKALTQSKEGVHVAMMCVWMGTPKERKKIVKELKEGAISLANGEYTHMLLLAIFDSVDDTVFIQKAVLTELLGGDLSALLNNTFGRKVLMYLCSRRDPKMFSAPIVATLAAGDNNPHSKKDAIVRASELQKFAVPFLLDHIAQNTSLWMDNNSNLLILLAALKVGFGDNLPKAINAIAKHVANPPNEKGKTVDLRIADNTGCHMVLKKLAQHDKVFTENGLATFGGALVAELSNEHYQVWLKNNHCCFLLLEILKNSSSEVVQNLRSEIKNASAIVWKKKALIPVGGLRIKELL